MEGSREVRIPDLYIRKIEEAVGAVLDLSEENKFASFDEVDELTKNRAKEIYYKVDEIRAIFYLKYVLKKGVERAHIFYFLFDVVIGGWIKRNGRDRSWEARIRNSI